MPGDALVVNATLTALSSLRRSGAAGIFNRQMISLADKGAEFSAHHHQFVTILPSPQVKVR